jgi:hypothetical protein
VLLVLQESMLILYLFLMALVIIVMQLAQPALGELILNARSVILLLLHWLMEMSAEDYVVQEHIGEHQIIVVNLV